MKIIKKILTSVLLSVSFISIQASETPQKEDCLLCEIRGLQDTEIQHFMRSKNEGAAYSLIATEDESFNDSNIDKDALVKSLDNLIQKDASFLKNHSEIKGFLWMDFIVVPSNNGRFYKSGMTEIDTKVKEELKCMDAEQTICSSNLIIYKGFIGNVDEQKFQEIFSKNIEKANKEIKTSQVYLLNKNFEKPLVFRTLIRVNGDTYDLKEQLIKKQKSIMKNNQSNSNSFI